MDILCSTIAAAAANCRFIISLAIRIPSASLTVLVSSIIVLHSVSNAGSSTIRSSVAPVRALMGLKHTLPQSLSQIFQANITSHRRLESRLRQCPTQSQNPFRSPAVGLADDESVELVMDDDAGFDYLAGRLHYAADGAFGSNGFPLTAARSDGFEPMPLEATPRFCKNTTKGCRSSRSEPQW